MGKSADVIYDALFRFLIASRLHLRDESRVKSVKEVFKMQGREECRLDLQFERIEVMERHRS